MRIIENTLDKLRPLFAEQGKLKRLFPVFQALDHFLFSAPLEASVPPFGRDPMDVKRYMSLVIVALLPCLAASLYFFGWRIIPMLIVSYAAGGIVEVLFAIIRKEEINEGFLVSGFIFPLILPPNTPFWIVAVGIAFGVLMGKEIFGGTGRNLFNSALIGRCFLILGYPQVMAMSWMAPAKGGLGHLIHPFSAFQLPDTVTSATPLVLAKNGQFSTLFDLFIGRVSGSAGETSALAILIGGVALMLLGIASYRTIASLLLSFTVLSYLLHSYAPEFANPPLFNLLSGGFLFGTFFMATDPVSSPITIAGKWVYGALIGIIAILIRTFSGFVEGVMFAILFGNICAPLIDEVFIRFYMRRYTREKQY